MSCVYVWIRGRLQGQECRNPVEPGTEFCGACKGKTNYQQQQNPLFRKAIKEWNLKEVYEYEYDEDGYSIGIKGVVKDKYFSPKYAFCLEYDGNFHLKHICIRPEDRKEGESIYRKPTEEEKQTARELGILLY